MQQGGMGGQMVGPDGQPIQESFLQKLMRWGMQGMEMMQMPMMMFSQVMMLFQQQAMSLMMAVMMLPEMLMMLPMVTEQINQMLGRSSTDPNTGLTIPAVNYTPPRLRVRVGRRAERRLSNLCRHVAGVGPIAEFGLKTLGLEPRTEEELNHLDWTEIIKKAEAEREQAELWAQQQADHAVKQQKEQEEMKQQMEQQAQAGQQQQGMGQMGMRSGGMGMYGGGMGGYGGRMLCIASPVNPAVFDHHAATPGIEYLRSSAAADEATPAEVGALVRELGGNPAARPECFTGRAVVDGTARATLVEVLDRQHSVSPQHDVKVSLSEPDLVALIGAAAVARVAGLFGGPFDAIKLRRVEAQGKDRKCIAFHTDFSQRTMQIPLNDPSEYSGGDLLFATGAGLVRPARTAGSAVIHTKNTVHGVTAMDYGVRYSLFVCDTRQGERVLNEALAEAAAVDLQYLIEPTLSQFRFFDRALPFAAGSTDAQMAGYVREYADFLASKAHPSMESRSVPSFAVELVWRTHLLHPQAYAKDCAALRRSGGFGLVDHRTGDGFDGLSTRGVPTPRGGAACRAPEAWPSIDLVAAVRRQQSFMRKILAQRDTMETAHGVSEGVELYRMFLGLMRRSAHTDLVPTAMIDLVWHTHQQFPVRYSAECRAIAGREVDHDDGDGDGSDDGAEAAESSLDRSFELTRRAWERAYRTYRTYGTMARL